MSKTSRFFLWVIIVGLAFIAGVRLYRAYEKYVAQYAQEPVPTMTFNNVPVQLVPPQAEEGVYKKWSDEPQEIYLDDGVLSPQQQKQQAQATVKSVLSDYRQEPKMQAFVADLRQATGRQDIDLAVLSSPQLGALMQQYPQLQQVVANYAKDPEFAKMLQEIFNNPQFVNSVQILQQKEVSARPSR